MDTTGKPGVAEASAYRMFNSPYMKQPLIALGGSWVGRSGVRSTLTGVIRRVTLLITPFYNYP